MNLLKALCIIVFFSLYAMGCGNLNSVHTDELQDQVNDQESTIIVSIASAGSIEIPEGALPEGAEVNVETIDIPLLPDNVVPLGKAYLIRSSTELTKPVILRLIIPDGAQDIFSLVIVRVTDDGITSILTSSIEGNEVVAQTPGFSTFVVAEKIIVAGKIKERFINVYGRDFLNPGEITSYSVSFGNTFSVPSHQSPIAQDIVWTVTGPFQVIQIRGLNIFIKVDSDVGPVVGDIAISFFDPVSGYNYSGIRKIRVQRY